MGLVILLIYGLLYGLRKLKHSPPSFKSLFPLKSNQMLIQPLYSHVLTATASLHLVDVAGHVLLLSVTGNEVKVLLELADENSMTILAKFRDPTHASS